MRIGAKCLSPFLVLVSVFATATEPASTKPESDPDRAVRFTAALEANPLGDDAPEQRVWLIRWLEETPDFTVFVCDILGPLPAEELPYGPELLVQQMFRNVTYQITHPGNTDEATLQIAGVESVLKAYSIIVVKDPKAHVPYFDDLLAKRESGVLKEHMLPVIAKACANGTET